MDSTRRWRDGVRKLIEASADKANWAFGISVVGLCLSFGTYQSVRQVRPRVLSQRAAYICMACLWLALIGADNSELLLIGTDPGSRTLYCTS